MSKIEVKKLHIDDEATVRDHNSVMHFCAHVTANQHMDYHRIEKHCTQSVWKIFLVPQAA